MRIAIDLRPALKKGTGVGTYVQNLVENLALIDQENHYCLFSSSFKDRFPREKLSLPDNFCVKDYRIPVRLLNFLWHKYRFPPLDYLTGEVDVTHSPGIIAVSENTKKDIIRLLKVPAEKVKVIYQGVAESFRHRLSPQSLSSLRKRFSLNGDYLLFVGAIEPRKNLVNLLRAFKGVVKKNFGELKLVIAGERSWHTEEFDRELQSPDLKERVVLTGYLSSEELAGLYQAARMLIFPSLGEGFGLPLVEAMASGIPIVSSKTSCIPEVVGDAAILIDPHSPQEIEEAICSLLTDSKLAEELTRRGLERSYRFSWKETAKQTLQLYRQIGGGE